MKASVFGLVAWGYLRWLPFPLYFKVVQPRWDIHTDESHVTTPQNGLRYIQNCFIGFNDDMLKHGPSHYHTT